MSATSNVCGGSGLDAPTGKTINAQCPACGRWVAVRWSGKLIEHRPGVPFPAPTGGPHDLPEPWTEAAIRGGGVPICQACVDGDHAHCEGDYLPYGCSCPTCLSRVVNDAMKEQP